MHSRMYTSCQAAAALSVMNLFGGCGDGTDDAAPENTSGVHVVGTEDPPPTSPENTSEEFAGNGMAGSESGDLSATDDPADEPIPEGVQRITFRGLRMFVPAEWERQPPASSMRDLQMRVPSGAPGETDAGFVVYGGIAGSVQENIQRWSGQFMADDGSLVEPQVEEMQAGTLRITIVELTGNYTSTMVPGESGADVTMIHAIVETPQREQVFLRLLGPRAVVAANRESLRVGLNSLAPAQ
jgi:hypothetical protein